MRRIAVYRWVASILLCGVFMCGCKEMEKEKKGTDNSMTTLTDTSGGNAVYYWKTTFQLNDTERRFLQTHHIKKIYLRFFDVDFEQDQDGTFKSIPIATTRFLDTVPAGIEVVPTVYITTKAIASDPQFTHLLFNRIKAMAKRNKIRDIHEVQLDCDWTNSTRYAFFDFCSTLDSCLSADSIKLSATIRLHQLKQKAPPVDKGVLMLYNTGSIHNPNTKNSILSYDDVEPYLRSDIQYGIPLDFAFPVYSWGILIRRNRTQCILRTTDYGDTSLYEKQEGNRYKVLKEHFLENHRLQTGDIIRLETSQVKEIREVKELVRSKIKQASYQSVIYHLDSLQLSQFKEQEIRTIYKND